MRNILLPVLLLLTVSVSSQVLQFSKTSGFYNESFLLDIQGIAADQIVRYTVDGSTPNTNSKIYSSPILIELDRKSTLSFVPTAESWLEPVSAEKEAVIFKCQIWNQDVPVSQVISQTYFIGPNIRTKYSVDIIALTIDSLDFFHEETGIYALGIDQYYNYYNVGDDWERPVFVELFDKTGSLEWSQNLGARIHGRSSRANPQKSLRLYAREEYGDPFIFHPLFGETNDAAFKRIILKAPDKLFNNSLLVDLVAYNMVRDFEMETMDERAVAMFINGEYWGVHFIRERQDEQYLRTKLGVDHEEVDIIDWDRRAIISEGNDLEFQKLMTFLQQTDLSTEEGLFELSKLVDLDNFTEYISAHIYFANEDFPNNNCRMWREHGFGKKWRFFFFDCDGCMRDYEQNSFARFTEERNDGNPVSLMLTGLMQNPEYSRKLSLSLISKLENSLSAVTGLTLLDSLQEVITPQMSFQINRWDHPNNFPEWHSAISDARTFLLKRSAFLNDQIQEILTKPFDVYPTPVKETLYVKFAETADLSNVRFTLFDSSGRTIAAEQSGQVNGLYTIALPNLPQGFYFLHTVIGNVSYFDKIIVS
jgi:hypothetical protein